MLKYKTGNLLEAKVEALVNTVNTVGVMGKGIALMFKEAFPENYFGYREACKSERVETGKMFVTECRNLMSTPRWIINFPTKQHWRDPSKLEWIEAGLQDLRRIIESKNIKSIALPPLGSGNGGLSWVVVRNKIEEVLGDLDDVEIVVYKPTAEYQNVTKKRGVQKLTPARALVAELVRRYAVLGIQCTLLEVQKLAYMLERQIISAETDNPLDLRYKASKFGPHADRLMKLLNAMDGSYLRSEQRIADMQPYGDISFNDARADEVNEYIGSEAVKPYLGALHTTSKIIDGFESPLGMELLATIDWLIHKNNVQPVRSSIRQALVNWEGGVDAGRRKNKLFTDLMIDVALARLKGAFDVGK